MMRFLFSAKFVQVIGMFGVAVSLLMYALAMVYRIPIMMCGAIVVPFVFGIIADGVPRWIEGKRGRKVREEYERFVGRKGNEVYR